MLESLERATYLEPTPVQRHDPRVLAGVDVMGSPDRHRKTALRHPILEKLKPHRKAAPPQR